MGYYIKKNEFEVFDVIIVEIISKGRSLILWIGLIFKKIVKF